MSDIKAGDLVMVVKPLPCCDNAKYIGRTFVVGYVARIRGICPACKALFRIADVAKVGGESDVGMHLQCLIRIDPPALPESVETDREVTA